MTESTMPELTPIIVKLSDGNVEVSGERITDHFAVTPQFGKTKDGRRQLTGGLSLTHIPTGLAISNDSMFVDFRKLAVALEATDVEWNFIGTLREADAEKAKAVFREQMYSTPDDTWPWPDWAGDESTPALSFLAGTLDDGLKNSEREAAKVDILEKIEDRELREKVDGHLRCAWISSTVLNFQVAYLLAVLYRVDPTAADTATRNLVGELEGGDGLGEWMHQWRQELADGRPLTLYSFPGPVFPRTDQSS